MANPFKPPSLKKLLKNTYLRDYTKNTTDQQLDLPTLKNRVDNKVPRFKKLKQSFKS